MERGPIGVYQITNTGDEPVHAFVPHPLPPNPPLQMDGTLNQALAKAMLALGRLDGISSLLSDPASFIYAYVRKEAVLSSQIEGTQSSLSDLLLYELEEAPGAPIDDVIEVSNHVAAMEHGLERLDNDFPLANRLIREIHGKLLSSGRGSSKAAGEFRTSQNWIGGTRPGNAYFVPPPHTSVEDCMAALEKFINSDDDGFPPLVRAGLAHVQFETIHPFLDGNGRVGRLLITLLLCRDEVLNKPMLYLSLYFKQHRSEYYDLLTDVRETGDWESWLKFFLAGVIETAEGAVDTANRLLSMLLTDRKKLENQGRRVGSVLRAHEAMSSQPILSLTSIRRNTGLSHPTASAAMDILVEQGVASEFTGRRRARLFAYSEYLAILNEGADMP